MRSARVRRIALAVVFLAAGAQPVGPAHAYDGAGCPDPSQSQKWTASRRCSFYVKGLPIFVHGEVTEAPAASNSIRVWVTPAGSPEIVLFECRESGTRYPSCAAGWPDSTHFTPPLPVTSGVPRPSLDCYVQGTGSGEFHCQSGTG